MDVFLGLAQTTANTLLINSWSSLMSTARPEQFWPHVYSLHEYSSGD